MVVAVTVMVLRAIVPVGWVEMVLVAEMVRRNVKIVVSCCAEMC